MRKREKIVTPGRALGYGRVSTVHQKYSLEAQENQIRKYHAYRLEPDGMPLLGVWTDPATSGGMPLRDRQAGFAMSMQLQPGDHVVVAVFDRAFRSTADALHNIEQWKERKITAHFLDLDIDTSTPWGEVLLTLAAVFAQLERRKIRERTRDALAVKKAKGEMLGNAPWGFRGEVISHRNRKRKRLVPDEYEMKCMLRIWELKENGESYARIQEKLKENGVTNPRGTTWSISSLHNLYHNFCKLLAEGKVPEYARPAQSPSGPPPATTTSPATPSQPTPAPTESSTSPSPDRPPQ